MGGSFFCLGIGLCQGVMRFVEAVGFFVVNREVTLGVAVCVGSFFCGVGIGVRFVEAVCWG